MIRRLCSELHAGTAATERRCEGHHRYPLLPLKLLLARSSPPIRPPRRAGDADKIVLFPRVPRAPLVLPTSCLRIRVLTHYYPQISNSAIPSGASCSPAAQPTPPPLLPPSPVAAYPPVRFTRLQRQHPLAQSPRDTSPLPIARDALSPTPPSHIARHVWCHAELETTPAYRVRHMHISLPALVVRRPAPRNWR